MSSEMTTQKERALIAKRFVELQLNKESGTAATLNELKDELGIRNNMEDKARVQRHSSSRS